MLKKQQKEQTRNGQIDQTIAGENAVCVSTDVSKVDGHDVSEISTPEGGLSLNGEDSNDSALEYEKHNLHYEDSCHSTPLTSGLTKALPVTNVAMHIDPTYLSQLSSSTPNSLIFQGLCWSDLIRNRYTRI